MLPKSNEKVYKAFSPEEKPSIGLREGEGENRRGTIRDILVILKKLLR